jgi:hypothetical protein
MARPIEIRRCFAGRLRLALCNAGIPECDHTQHLGSMAVANSQLPTKWLQGLSEPTRTTLTHIAIRLDVRPEWLLNGSGGMKQP